MMKRKTLLSWSSGKDSAWALYQLQRNPEIEVVGLFTTINTAFARVAMHGVRLELLQQQAAAVGLPLHLIAIPYPCSNEEYANAMQKFVNSAKQDRIECFAFGDLFLEDVRQYREDRLTGTGITPIFPLWGTPTDRLSHEMIASGLKAVITCIDPKQLPGHFAGKFYDAALLEALPDGVDPCGEYGEFHSFAFAGPMFQHTLAISVGETVQRDGFVFTDIRHLMSAPW
jgi:uncharacterized protein (TIGR00290 family)